MASQELWSQRLRGLPIHPNHRFNARWHASQTIAL